MHQWLRGAAAAASACGAAGVACVWLPIEAKSAAARSAFDDDALRAAIPRRVASEKKLREYLSLLQSDEEAAIDRDEVELAAQKILFGVTTPHARREYLRKYGCARWTPKALDAIAAHSPLIEIGAGSGRWANELRTKCGANVLAFDNRSSLAPSREGSFGADAVYHGDETMLLLHPERTLFLCYPPGAGNRMAERCVRVAMCDTIAYVGEGRGGVNGTREFFDVLDAEWHVAECIELDPFPESYERLYILRRTS